MNKTNLIYALGLIGSLIALPALANDANTAIRASNLSFEYAINSGNPEALSALYTDDAIVLPPTDETLVKPAAIRQFWQEALQTGMRNIRLANFDIRVEGDTAYQAAIWSAETTGANGDTHLIGGNMLNIFSRQADGSWKPRMQSWN